MSSPVLIQLPGVGHLRRLVRSWPVQLAAILGLAVYMISLCWWTETHDMRDFLLPWFDHIVSSGPVTVFAHPFSNYTPPYLYLLAFVSLLHGAIEPMYLIKALSLVGTGFAAFAIADLVGAMGGPRRYAVLLFVLPSAVINAALLGQCDAFWAGACVLAVASMIRGSTLRAMLWCGVAFAFKAQAAFIAPAIIGVLIGRRAPLWQWTVPALTFAALMTPAWLAGWPAVQLAMIYPTQSGSYDFPGSLANPWIFATIYAPDAAGHFYWLGYGAAGAAAVATGLVAAGTVSKPRAMLFLALLSALALPFLLPKMHERYFFLADLLSLAAAISFPRRTVILSTLATQLASLLSLITYLFYGSWAYPTFAGVPLAMLAIILAFTLARTCSAEWPRFRISAGPPLPASGARTAA
jgi:Gpi18-like mannosyltransferase